MIPGARKFLPRRHTDFVICATFALFEVWVNGNGEI